MGNKTSQYLILGASGHIGRAIYQSALDHGISTTGTRLTHEIADLTELDITEREAVSATVKKVSPEIVFLCAGLTDVEKCERWHHKSFDINVNGVRNVVDAANRVGARVVYISSALVFDGKSAPYSEKDPANPLSIYGTHKLIAEHFISTNAVRHLIIRTQTVYGWEDMGNSSVSRLMQKLRHNSSSEIAKDLISSPTYDKCLARAILELCAEEATGVFNVAGAASCSLYKFALQTARIFGLDQSLIHPISAQDMGWRAARPLNSSLSVKKVQNIIKTMLLPFDIGLEQMLNDEL